MSRRFASASKASVSASKPPPCANRAFRHHGLQTGRQRLQHSSGIDVGLCAPCDDHQGRPRSVEERHGRTGFLTNRRCRQRFESGGIPAIQRLYDDEPIRQRPCSLDRRPSLMAGKLLVQDANRPLVLLRLGL